MTPLILFQKQKNALQSRAQRIGLLERTAANTEECIRLKNVINRRQPHIRLEFRGGVVL